MAKKQAHAPRGAPPRGGRALSVGHALLMTGAVIAIALISLAAVLAALDGLVRGFTWSLGMVAPYVREIGWWVGIPILAYGTYESVTRMTARRQAEAETAHGETAAHAATAERTEPAAPAARARTGRTRTSRTPPSRTPPSRARTPLFCVGAATMIVAGNVASSMAASRIDSFARESRPRLSETYTNHDLAKLMGECLGAQIRRFATNEPSVKTTPDSDGAPLNSLASAAPEKWIGLVMSSATAQGKTPASGDAPAEGKTPANGDVTTEGQIPLPITDEQILDLLTSSTDAKALGASFQKLLAAWNEQLDPPVSDESIAALSDFIAENFGHTLREALKEDFSRGGRAWPAIQLDIATRLLRNSMPDDPTATVQAAQTAKMLSDTMSLPKFQELLAQAKASSDQADTALANQFTLVANQLDVLARQTKEIRDEQRGEPVFEGFTCRLLTKANVPLHQAGRFPARAPVGLRPIVQVDLKKTTVVLSLMVLPNGDVVWLRPFRHDTKDSIESARPPELGPANGEAFAPSGGKDNAGNQFWEFGTPGAHCILLLAFDANRTPDTKTIETVLTAVAKDNRWHEMSLTESWLGLPSGLVLAEIVRGPVPGVAEPEQLAKLRSAINPFGAGGTRLQGLRDFRFIAIPVHAAQ